MVVQRRLAVVVYDGVELGGRGCLTYLSPANARDILPLSSSSLVRIKVFTVIDLYSRAKRSKQAVLTGICHKQQAKICSLACSLLSRFVVVLLFFHIPTTVVGALRTFRHPSVRIFVDVTKVEYLLTSFVSSIVLPCLPYLPHNTKVFPTMPNQSSFEIQL